MAVPAFFHSFLSMKETEIKLAIEDAGNTRRALRKLGWRVSRRRSRETNVVFDAPGNTLFAEGKLLRLRRVGSRSLLTAKRPSGRSSRYKVRQEFETEIADPESLEAILATLNFTAAWRYEKFRTEFGKPARPGKILFDETPVGDFLELEGEPAWIDRAAESLGFDRSAYIVDNYRGLFEDYRRRSRARARDMLFGEPGLSPLPQHS